MCGICGVFRINEGEPVSRAAVEAMTRAIAHRGPDDSGVALFERAALGFRRLSIIDLDTGHQPLANEDETLWLVCNGEIYNHRALRAELAARGHRFRTRTDVEVLLHLYEELGEAMLERLNGQFAFAILDRRRGRLFLARDPFGVAPLFYTVTGGTFLFGSEIKAILAHPGVERRVDMTGLDQVLALPGLVSPRTMFAGIDSLPPGHALVVDGEGVRSRPYWDLVYPDEAVPADPRSEDRFREELAHRLTEAVRRRLQADVPVGAYLSGGLDSSLVVALMRACGAEAVETFSIAFADALLDEREHQRLMAAHLGSRHHEIELDGAGIERRLRTVVRHSECPVRESYNTASFALSAAARAAGVPVVLSGEGADELFAGYVGYRYDAFRRARGPAAPPAPREAELRHRLWGDDSVFYERSLADHEGVRRGLYAAGVADGFEAFEFTQFRLVDPERLKGRHPLHQRAYLDLKLRLGDHLVGDHGDRMLLGNAVEGRFPFLDVEVAELAARMPPDLKLNGFTEKYILKQVARPLLPAGIVEREKHSFRAPGSPQLLRAGIDWVEDLLSSATIRRHGYFDVAAVEALKAGHRASDMALAGPDEEDLLMIVLTFGLFVEEFDMPRLGA
ncbi:asparagine synthase (glutamine-hydrolyzing) [Azospirillum sp. 412522]|nr:asparagine synthase (glutamine-hydrolyzing) [Azospirillum sp. 412522]MBY6263499.1 asparagine synthase (glutamine-hydrolyzing) [Azospirillum sp. 412522]